MGVVSAGKLCSHGADMHLNYLRFKEFLLIKKPSLCKCVHQ